MMAENGKLMKDRNRVDEVFANRTLLISGGTGFMGKVLVEKILRTCPGVKRIYLLVRNKKGKNSQERLKEMFNSALFDLLKATVGKEVLNKVHPISGDVLEKDLGLSKENREKLANETNIIYHLAATIRFDDPLKKAVLLNVRGTKYMLQLAKECKNLIVFNHVSTAYCHLKEKILYERAYPPPTDPHMIIKLVEWMDEKVIDSITEKILEGYPNSYAFTKALGEALVVDELDNLPVIILRPSVVIPVWREPLPGWTDNINGPTGLLIAAGKGVLRTMYCDSNSYADFLPVDIAVNVLMVAPMDFMVYNTRRIYNCTSSFEYKVTWEDIITMGRRIVEYRLPLNGVVWYPGGSMKSSRLYHYLCVIFTHYIPAIVLDSILYLSGHKPILWRVQQRITKGFEVFEYYANNQWDFNNDESLKARQYMTEKELELYKVDGQGMDMDEYFYNCTHAARLYLLKESDETIPAAKRHMTRMWILDRLVKFLIVVGFFYMLYQYLISPIMRILT